MATDVDHGRLPLLNTAERHSKRQRSANTHYLATKGAEEISVEALKRDKMLAISASTSFVQDSWPVYECVVVCQVELEGQRYVLSGGDWFRVNLGWKEPAAGARGCRAA